MKTLTSSLRLFLILSLLTGGIYPLCVTLLANIAHPEKSHGSMILNNQKYVGSKMIGQKFESEKYFWSRPSAVDYNSSSSGGSNSSLSSKAFISLYHQRKNKVTQAHQMHSNNSIPQDLLFASASGLDPHISPEAAHYQVIRVASSRKIDKTQLRDLIEKSIEPRQFGVFGEPRVNIVLLNLALDQDFK